MSHGKILYVDDEEDLLEIAVSFFEEEQMSLDICSNFTQALGLLHKNNYDVIISDANMPSGTGSELFKIVKKELLFKGKFILLTGDILSHEQIEDLAFDKIFFKPVDFQELIKLVKSYL
jgi:DNA-binding NtrC family response regulator